MSSVPFPPAVPPAAPLPATAPPRRAAVQAHEQYTTTRLDWWLLALVIGLAGPAMAALRFGTPTPGAYWLFGGTGLVVGFNILRGTPYNGLALLTACVPVLMLTRAFVFYNAVLMLYAAAIVGVLVRSPIDAACFRRTLLQVVLFVAALYWLASFVMTGEYFANLRTFELLFSAIAIVVLVPRRTLFAAALFGLMLCVAIVGMTLLSMGERMGLTRVAGVSIGNPIAFGIPLALLLILINASAGRWLLLQRQFSLRLALGTGIGMLLFLSTSRGSWLVAAAGIGMLLIADRRSRKMGVSAALAVAVALVILMQTHHGANLSTWFDRTFSSERSLTNRTSGRSDQWMIFPAVVRDLPLLGFGPGSGKEIYARYSILDDRVRLHPGENIAWHSLYQHITVETGIIGGMLLILLFGRLLTMNFATWRRTRELLPALGTVGFMLIGLTVSGVDAASGLFLGLGMVDTAALRQGGVAVQAPTDGAGFAGE